MADKLVDLAQNKCCFINPRAFLGWLVKGGGGGDGIHHIFITLALFDGVELNLVQ